jgi:hypothetical protein
MTFYGTSTGCFRPQAGHLASLVSGNKIYKLKYTLEAFNGAARNTWLPLAVHIPII